MYDRIPLLLALLAASCASPPGARFESPEGAVDALVLALRTHDRDRLLEIAGPGNAELFESGDEASDRDDRRRFVALYDEKHRLVEAGDGAWALNVGEIDYPMPIPIVHVSDGWTFDVEAGREEVIHRWIGRNELETIQVCLAAVDAQREYYAIDRDGDGLREYARHLVSSPGRRDGLYWPTEEGGSPSPLGELFARAADKGYTRAGGEREPYRGYFYRLLVRQGEHAPGGAYDYVVGDDMIGGFALIAYPAEYGRSGVMSFIVNHDGLVHEKDLGPRTSRLARELSSFDPEGWTVVSAQ